MNPTSPSYTIELTAGPNSPQAPITDSSSKKRSQLIIRVYDEALTVVAMRVSNPDTSHFVTTTSLALA